MERLLGKRFFLLVQFQTSLKAKRQSFALKETKEQSDKKGGDWAKMSGPRGKIEAKLKQIL